MILTRFTGFLRSFLGHQRGVALIEFAMVMPFMLLLVFGAIEYSRYILIIQKLQKSAYALTDIVGQYPSATTKGLPDEISVANMTRDAFQNFDKMMAPYGTTAQEMVVFSSVIHRRAPSRNLIRWQRTSKVGSLTEDVTSIVTGSAPRDLGHRAFAACPVATFNSDVNDLLRGVGTVEAYDNENFIVGEVYFRYQPIIGRLLRFSSSQSMVSNGQGGFSLEPRTLTRRIFIHPRNDVLLDLPPDSPVVEGTGGNCA